MRIALLQLNPTVGDLEGNAALIAAAVREAGRVDLCVTSEMALTGYRARDLLLQPQFTNRANEVVEALAADLVGAAPVLVGMPVHNTEEHGRPLFNAAVFLRHGRIERVYHKSLLPTYDVFDEDRYFEPGSGLELLVISGHRCAISVCEDVWNDRDFWQRPRYDRDPIEETKPLGADVLLNLSASPFAVGKQDLRERMLASLARKQDVAVVYVNQVGGNDDLLFDGRSVVIGADGELQARARAFDPHVMIVELEAAKRDASSAAGASRGRSAEDASSPRRREGAGDAGRGGVIEPSPDSPEEEIYRALVLGTRDYARKCGFSQVLLGLSGGIDSALTAAIAAEALGPDRVLGVLMPSPYSSPGSVNDSLDLTKRLGIRSITLPIEPLMKTFDEVLATAFAGYQKDVTEENIQARARGNLLMALANKYGALLLTTGNKSELSVGYCTLYGDMSGGLAVIADVPKTMVYRIAEWVNRREEIIPPAILTKPPSAELRPNQTDQDSLPPYDVLDEILERHIERYESAETIVAAGFPEETVRRVLRLVRLAEFKRRQAAPGLRVTDRAFGTGWRMPIARADWESARPAAAPLISPSKTRRSKS
jgi:NAD+ synthase (glutamine-hydrolysing)